MGIVAAVALVALAVAPSALAAETPPKFWKTCPNGIGAAQCRVPRGIASDPVSGHLYLADQNNSRVVELDAWGEFVKAWGWGVKDGANELQVCTRQTQCRDGLFAGGRGELNTPVGVAADSTGGIYVVEFGNNRVQKFDREGHFVLMFGGKVNKTKVEAAAPPAEQNLCPVDPGDVCQSGSAGAGVGEFKGWPPSTFIAVGPANTVYVGDEGRIQKFDANGNYLANLPDPEGLLAGNQVQSLALDPSGNVFVALVGKADVLKLSPAGTKICTATIANPRGLASDGAGNLYAVNLGTKPEVLEFGPSCARNEVPAFGADELTVGVAPNPGIATGSACYTPGKLGIYLTNPDGNSGFVRAYAPAPDKLDGEGHLVCPIPPHVPTIDEQKVSAAEPETTTLVAQVNPHFWPDAHYYLEYGTGRCSEGGCGEKQPAPPGLALGGGTVNEDLLTSGVTLADLAPATTYHYRFVAQSGGGGPVYGIDPDGEDGPAEASFAKGAEGTFRTFDEPCPSLPCPLPDGRAYEQVSPIQKAGFDVDRGLVIARPDGQAVDGQAVIYGSPGAFSGAREGAFPSTYLASRQAGGWGSEALEGQSDPSGEVVTMPVLGVSGDFGKQLVLTNAKLSPEAVGEDNTAINIYVHDSATGAYQYVGTAYGRAETGSPLGDVLVWERFAGATADGSRFFFSIHQSLTGATPAPPGSEGDKLYEFVTATGQLNYLGVLPDESITYSFPAGVEQDQTARAAVAFRPVSEDGARVYWTQRSATAPLYLREGGQTTLVSERQSDSSAQAAELWGTSADGGAAFLTSAAKLTAGASATGTDLYRYDADADQLSDLTPDSTDPGGAAVQKVLGVSRDGAYVYFIANGNLATGASGEAAKIYAWHEGATRLIGALATGASQLSGARTSVERWRISPDGRYLGFLFAGRIEGPHPQSPSPFRQAYLYDYGADSLDCASCPPGPASADVSLHGPRGSVPGSSLTGYEAGLTRNVTDAGQFFFQSKDPLVIEDHNARQDVYEYEAGQVQLISSGQAPTDSYFGDATPSGNDAYFLTRQSLVGQDKGELVDLYDARVGGGIAAQNQPDPVPCDPNVNCQGSFPPAPVLTDPATPGFEGPPSPEPSRCKAGFASRGGKCVKAHKAKKHHRHHKRGGSR